MLSIEKQNEIREKYRVRNPGWRPATEIFADLVRSKFTRGSRVLDLGCGRGGLVEQLQPSLGFIAGLDADIVSLREHRLARGIDSFPRIAAVSERLPFREDSFDIIFASWTLEHIEKPEKTFRQIGRVIHPGGIFVFITPNRLHPLVRLNLQLGRVEWLQVALVEKLYGRDRQETFMARYRANTTADLTDLARIAGMRINQLEMVVDPSYVAFRPGLLRLASRLDSWLAERQPIHITGEMVRE